MLINRVSSATALKACYFRSITEIPADDWNRLFPGVSEGWEYFSACERVAPDVFKLSALGVMADEELIAAVPTFQIDYRLETSLPLQIQELTRRIERHFPCLVRVPMLAMGSPYSEECQIGYAPGLCEATRTAAFGLLTEGLQETAAERGIKLTAIKDLPHEDMVSLHGTLKDRGFARFSSLPVANLHLPFENLDGYIGSLSRNTRKDLKRKMNQSKNVSVEVRDSLDGIRDEVVALYRQTQSNRKMSYDAFDMVPDAYFEEVMAGVQPFAKVMVYRVKGELAGFSLMLVENDRVIGKFVGLDYALSRKHNIYFVNWLETVRYCIENDIPNLQTGQTTYALKAKLGCTLNRSWIYFDYESAVLGPLFRFFGPQFGLDGIDPDLKALGCNAPYAT